MKKTIISIIGIAVMLLAITACRPNYVIVPIPGGGTSSTPSGTPVADLVELKAVLAKGDEARLTKNLDLEPNALKGLSGTINGAGNTINLQSTTDRGEQAFALILNNVSLKNVTIDASKIPQTRAAENTFAVLIGSGDGNMDNAPSDIKLSNVTIKTGGTIAGINVHTAKNVTLEDITIDNCLKAPVSISSSTVTIDGITAKGSDWYGTDNVIQVNGLKGDPAHKASTITFKSTGNIDRVWVEAVAADYNAAGDITDSNFNTGDQTVIKGLDWEVRYSDQASKSVKGWTYYKSDVEATTFTLNKEGESLADDELVAMIAAVKGSVAKDHAYDVIKLSQDVTLDSQLAIDTPITIDGADSFTISRANTPSEDAVGTKAAILITSSDVALKDLIVSGPDTNPGSEASNWDKGEYAIKAYATGTEGQLKNIVLDGVTIKNANAGMLVRGAAVELKGNIVLDTLGFGGFGVDSVGEDTSLVYDSDLTVASGCQISYTGTGSTEKPAIWTEHSNDSNETVIGAESIGLKKMAGPGDKSAQTWYVTDSYITQ